MSLPASKGLLRSYFANFHYERFLDNWQSVNTSTSSGFALTCSVARARRTACARREDREIPLFRLMQLRGWQGEMHSQRAGCRSRVRANPPVENRSWAPSFEVLLMHPRPSCSPSSIAAGATLLPFAPAFPTNVSARHVDIATVVYRIMQQTTGPPVVNRVQRHSEYRRSHRRRRRSPRALGQLETDVNDGYRYWIIRRDRLAPVAR